MSIIYSLHANNDINALFSSYPMNLILLRLIEERLCVNVIFNSIFWLSSSCFTFGKVEASFTLRSLTQHLSSIFNVDTLRWFLLQPAA